MELLLHAPEAGGAPPTLEEIVAAFRSSPLRSVDRDRIAHVLAEHAGAMTETRSEVGEVAAPPYDGLPCAVVISPDRLAAYVVPVVLPATSPATIDEPSSPSAGDQVPAEPSSDATAPPLVTTAQLRSLLAASAVIGGLLDDVINGFGDGAPLADIRCVARGQRPIPGVAARLEYHVDQGAPRPPVSADEHGTVDFHELAVQRFVSAGTPLITKHPMTPGTAGCNVLGVVTEPPRVQDIDLARLAGPNTTVEGDVVTANVTGRPVVNPQGAVEVLPIFEVAGDVDYAVGNIDFPGDVVVRGDVKSGFSITSGGSISVKGIVERASLTAAHDISVMGAVSTTIEAGGDLSARYLHSTESKVAQTVNVVGEIVNCTITADRVHTSSQGRIVGGVITAHLDVDTGTLGSRDGKATEVHVTSQEPEAVIRARRAAQPGVVIVIGGARKQIQDEIDGASFWEVSGSVLALKAMADLAAAEAARAA